MTLTVCPVIPGKGEWEGKERGEEKRGGERVKGREKGGEEKREKDSGGVEKGKEEIK